MKVTEVYVSISQAERIFEVIKQSISVTKNIQIFVAEKLMKELMRNGSKHNVSTFNGMGCFHYNKDDDGSGGETWFAYHESNSFSPIISSASFISNCNDYYQLVEFPDDDYTHYIVGFKELLLIEVDTN